MNFKFLIEYVVEFDCGFCGNFNSCYVLIFVFEYIYIVLYEYFYWIELGLINRWMVLLRLRRLNVFRIGFCCFCLKKFILDI